MEIVRRVANHFVDEFARDERRVALVLRHHGLRPLVEHDLRVVDETDDEHVARRLRLPQRVRMPVVQHVKAPVEIHADGLTRGRRAGARLLRAAAGCRRYGKRDARAGAVALAAGLARRELRARGRELRSVATTDVVPVRDVCNDGDGSRRERGVVVARRHSEKCGKTVRREKRK